MAITEVRPDERAPEVLTRPEPPRWRGKVLPRSVLGICTLILFTALGAAFSGAVLYSYYEYRLTQNTKELNTYIERFDKRYQNALGTITLERENARKLLRAELEPLEKVSPSAGTVAAMVKRTAPSLWVVRTTDEGGQPSVGTAFVVASDASQSFMLTSMSVVRAATRAPGPEITVNQRDQPPIKATLWTWHPDRDLALLVVPYGRAAKLPWATGAPAQIGERVFALSALGGAGGAATQGFVADVSAPGVQHTTTIGTAFRGGPLVDSNGEVVGVDAPAYAPLGFDAGSVPWAVPIRAACERVLRCPASAPPEPGPRK